jgi:hypothetical protein
MNFRNGVLGFLSGQATQISIRKTVIHLYIALVTIHATPIKRRSLHKHQPKLKLTSRYTYSHPDSECSSITDPYLITASILSTRHAYQSAKCSHP